MNNEKIKLQDAFNRGFIPLDLKEAMQARGHTGQVWIVDNTELNETRLGVGYKLANEDGSEQTHICWYSIEEVQELLTKI